MKNYGNFMTEKGEDKVRTETTIIAVYSLQFLQISPKSKKKSQEKNGKKFNEIANKKNLAQRIYD